VEACSRIGWDYSFGRLTTRSDARVTSTRHAGQPLHMVSGKVTVPPFERRKPARRPLPEHLPRERIVYPLPAICPCCGGGALRKIGEDVTETLELIPRQWTVIQHVREKLSCRTCEAITRPPAPSHPIARGRAGRQLLAHILFSKYSLHLPWSGRLSAGRHRP
jgi:transposase